MTPRRVLIVGAYFAPSSLPPALRIRNFAQHLSEFGWRPTIVTAQPRYYEEQLDAENLQLVPKDLDVVRTPAVPARLSRRLGVGDLGMRTFSQHWRALIRLCRRHAPDVVFIPVPPSIPMLIGRLVHTQFGVPYVVDYIDPWVSDYYWRLPKHQRPPKWAQAYALARVVEPIALRRVAHVVGVSQGTIDSVVSRYAWLSPANGTAIPYGGEPGDMDYVRQHPRSNAIFSPSDGGFHLTYTGACLPAMHGTLRALFAAIALGREQSAGLFSRLRVHFVGTSYAPAGDAAPRVLPLAEEAGIRSIVDEHPDRVPYLDALQLLLDSHGLVVVGSDLPHYTASKIFPYILARRPLLAVFHRESSVVTIMRETRAGHVITFDAAAPPESRVADIAQALERMLRQPARSVPETPSAAFEPYTARAMTRQLAEVFDQVCASRDGSG